MPKIAVILLPGILGSPLVNEYGEEAWPIHEMSTTNVSNVGWWSMHANFEDKLKLFVDVSDDFMPRTLAIPASITKTAINRVAPFYHDFLAGLRDSRLKGPDGKTLKFNADEYLVHVINYDWSRPVIDSCVNVVRDTYNFVFKERCEKFIYLTHSMGGIVGMATLGNKWIQENCLGIVRVACPVAGAVETVARLFRGIKAGWGDIEEYFLSLILGDSGPKFSIFAACIPGLASLLPQFPSGDQRPTLIVKAILDHHFDGPARRAYWYNEEDRAYMFGRKHLTVMKNRFEANIITANILIHRNLIPYEKTIREKVIAVALSGKQTLQRYTVNKKDNNNPSITTDEVWDTSGDGTVPVRSQTLFAGNDNPFPRDSGIEVSGGIEHANAFSDKRTWPYIIAAMNELMRRMR
ncbi:MAG TPA: hypothetical protein VJ810_23360 [Blastocatellia bacterium]|nr:hypothetical protein [Blastocatellia bacterium]